jgi:hypothetical protein
MCQEITQGTTCTNNLCKCFSGQYFNNGNNKCETLLIFNLTCIQSDACESTLGLSCQSGICKCSSTQFWKSNSLGCINFYNYNNGSCAETNQCQTGLICKNSTYLSCSCPTTVSDSYCDCPTPVYGSEYYYNGSNCVPSRIINESCTHNSTCQQITRGLFCHLNMCSCAYNFFWNGTKCVTCLSSWYYFRGSCFRVSLSNYKISNIDSAPKATVQTSCFGEASSRLAILYNSDLNPVIIAAFPNVDAWFDAYRNVSGSSTLYSFYTPGLIISSSNATVWNNGNNNDKCARFETISVAKFYVEPCNQNKDVFCEMIAF